jgi:ferritin-like metal-binding protein YciE
MAVTRPTYVLTPADSRPGANAALAAEHYEIARCGSLIAWARQLGRNEVAGILQKTLEEEKATDKKLTTLAETKVNLRAAS